MNFEPLKLTIRNDNFKGDEKRDYDDRYDKRPYDDMPSYSGPKDYPKRDPISDLDHRMAENDRKLRDLEER